MTMIGDDKTPKEITPRTWRGASFDVAAVEAPVASHACLLAWLNKNRFILGMLLAILLALAHPKGASFLYPEITAGWIAVCFIFLMSGLSLKSAELKKASKRLEFHVAVQAFNLCFLTLTIFAMCRGLAAAGLQEAIADGMVLCAALPMTVNMVIVLTATAGGDEAAAIFNSALGNLLGIFVTPAWVLALLGQRTDIDFASVVLKLVLRVMLPVFAGQVLQFQFPDLKKFTTKHKPRFKKVQEFCLIFIVYTVFCRTFAEGAAATAGEVALVVLLQVLLLLAAKVAAWQYMAVLFPLSDDRPLRVMGWFGCVHKTVAMGIPLLQAMFSGDERLGMYCLPLLVWHPAQLFIGSWAAPHVRAWMSAAEVMKEGDVESTGPGPAVVSGMHLGAAKGEDNGDEGKEEGNDGSDLSSDVPRVSSVITTLDR